MLRATTATLTSVNIELSSILPILASATLAPHASGGTIRWASNHGADTCVYVIDLDKEPAFRVGIPAPRAPACWGIFLYSGQASARYRGLAYSMLRTDRPPPSGEGRWSAGAWNSSWYDGLNNQTLAIPTGLLSIAVGASAVLAGTRLSAIFPKAQVGWDAPIRLPTFTVQPALSLHTYGWSTADANEAPDRFLRTVASNNYKPELFGSGVRWFYKGETTSSGATSPDVVYVHESSLSALSDEPALSAIGVPTVAKWIVYKSSGASPPALTLLAYTASRSSVGGIGGTPPAGGGSVWLSLVPGQTPSAIRFALTEQDLKVIHT